MLALLLSLHLAHADPDTATVELPLCREMTVGVESSLSTPRPTGLVQATAWLWLRGYQLLISPADGATCTMFPTCSQYAIESFGREGPLIGLWMTAARLMNHHDDPHYERCTLGDRVYRYDPPEEDAWWR